MFVKPFNVDNAKRVKSFDFSALSSIKRWFTAPARVQRLVLDEPRAYSRAHPAALFGTEVDDFSVALSQPPQSTPWSGFIFARNAVTAGTGETFVDDQVLVGTGLMSDPAIFPHPYHVLLDFKPAKTGFQVALPRDSVRIPGLVCNLASAGLQIYGHWLLDCLPRARFALSQFPTIDSFLLPAPTTAWKEELLQLIGVPRERTVFYDLKRVAVECEAMLLPSFFRFNSELRPDVTDMYASLTRSHHHSAQLRKIFVSRSQWPGARPLANRAEIETIFGNNGFDILYPENYNVHDLIDVFANAEIVAGECGSGMHNTLFCSPGTRIGVLQNSRNTNFLQAQIAMWQHHTISYLVGKSVDSTGDGPFSIDLGEARRFIRSLVE